MTATLTRSASHNLLLVARDLGPPGEPFEFVGHAVQPLAAPATVAGVP